MTDTHSEVKKHTNTIRNKTRAITVETLMRENAIDHIDIFKIDIEGAEREVFMDPPRGSRKWIV